MVPVYQYLGEYEKCEKVPITFPPQHQNVQPGMEYEMMPRPISAVERERERLRGKTAIITGGDSGIGRAVAYAFAREGANVAIAYLNEERDALETQRCVERMGQRCILIPGDLKKRCQAREVVSRTIKELGEINILVNNHAVQYIQRDIEDITEEQLQETFGAGTSKVPMMRAGQPFEVAPCYVFLASEDSSYMTGQVLHPNGGTIVGS